MIFKQFYAEQHRFVLWIPVFFFSGILFYFSLLQEPSFFNVVIVTVAIFFMGFCLYPIQEMRLFVVPLLCFVLGFFVVFLKTHWLNTNMLKAHQKDVFVQGEILDIEIVPEKKKQKVILKLHEDLVLKYGFSKVKLSYLLKNKDMFQVGDEILGRATFMTYSLPTSLFSYYFKREAFYKGISASGFLKKIDVVKKKEHRFLLSNVRYNLADFLRQSLNGQYAEIANALITGVKTGISNETRLAFSASGLSHILAISGLHITLIAGFIFLMIRKILALWHNVAKRYNTKKIACLICLPFTFFYVSLSGFGYPAIRAFCMLTFFCGAVFFDRFPISMRSVALAAMVVLMLFPESAVSISFQLSFAAVIGLIAFYESYQSIFVEWQQRYKNTFFKKISFYFIGVFFTTLIATISTTPIALYYFYQISFVSIVANIIAVPLTAFFIMPMALLSVVSYFTYPLSFVFGIFEQGIMALNAIAYWGASLPLSQIPIHQPSPLYIVLFSFGFLWVCIFQTSFRYFGFLPILLAVITFMDRSHLPDIYVASQGNMMAYKKNNILLTTNTQNTFYLDQWRKEQGFLDVEPINEKQLMIDHMLIVQNPWEIEKEKRKCIPCQEITLSNGYLPHCFHMAKIFVDKDALKRLGNHFIWLAEKKVITDKEYFGHRPWT